MRSKPTSKQAGDSYSLFIVEFYNLSRGEREEEEIHGGTKKVHGMF